MAALPSMSLTQARNNFHQRLLSGPLTVDQAGVPSNADKSSKASVRIAQEILTELGGANTAVKLPGQTSGTNFEDICKSFIEDCFVRLSHVRPGKFTCSRKEEISDFEQYQHLAALEQLASKNSEVATALGNDYLIKPDVLVRRAAETDAFFNSPTFSLDMTTGRHAPLRAVNQQLDILHASISCKWTLRSDRAQNARSEGLNLVRNRKGRLPHVVVITGEPTPGRIASLAFGTGEMDCVYHFALPELQKSVNRCGYEDAEELLTIMITGNRLRDIADLPLDLII